jgi:hypothetical protein
VSDNFRFLLRSVSSFFSICLLVTLVACNPPQRVSAETRMFRDFSLEFLGQYKIPKTKFKDTMVGGLSAIAYNREEDKFYVLSDDRGKRSPVRFYTFKLEIEQLDQTQFKIKSFQPENVTLIQDEQGHNYPIEQIDPEGLAISPRKTIFIASEGNTAKNIKPFIAEFDLKTGKQIADIALPPSFLPSDNRDQPQGVSENLAFESLTINRVGLPEDPFRLFTATESSLIQDRSSEEKRSRLRFLHYVVNPVGEPVLVAEHLYLLDAAPVEVISNGLTELLALQTEGYFLSLERTFGFTGAGAKIFQVVVGNATDTSNVASLKGDLGQLRTLKKQLILDLQDLGIELDNLEGMTLGPRLADGSSSLLLISDDNFNQEQISQLLLFRLVEN